MLEVVVFLLVSRKRHPQLIHRGGPSCRKPSVKHYASRGFLTSLALGDSVQTAPPIEGQESDSLMLSDFDLL
jgi:hypothetical protein